MKSGDYLRLDSDFLSLILAGYFRYGVEEFYLDGSASNADAPGQGGTTCRLYQARMHLDGIVRSATRFDGTLSVQYDVPGPDASSVRCRPPSRRTSSSVGDPAARGGALVGPRRCP